MWTKLIFDKKELSFGQKCWKISKKSISIKKFQFFVKNVKTFFGQQFQKVFLVRNVAKVDFWSKMSKEAILSKMSKKLIYGQTYRKISKKSISGHKWNTYHNIGPLKTFLMMSHIVKTTVLRVKVCTEITSTMAPILQVCAVFFRTMVTIVLIKVWTRSGRS